MRILILVLVFASTLAAQRGRGTGGFRGAGGPGFRGGGVHRPGFVGPGGFNRAFIGGYHRGFAGRGFRAGWYGNHRAGWYPFYPAGRSWYGGGFISYGGWYGGPIWGGYSPYYSGYSDYYGYPAPAAPPPVAVITTPSIVDTAPSTIIINSEYGRPQQVPRQPEEQRERNSLEERRSGVSAPKRSPIYLIALQDGAISAAVAYSVENGTLSVITLRGERKQIPLAQIDRSLTEQLNEERRVSFRLP